ncbi:MAG: exonuclease domain-containing protein [Clostridia bacterium]|nr:exonuclease domain-containing protein [Clostridia bacterium]
MKGFFDRKKGKSLSDRIDDYVALDLETTGFEAGIDEIIEFGAARVRGGEVVETFQQLVKPQYGISPEIARITGITNDMVADCPRIEEVLPRFLDFVGDDVVVAHNANFDVNFLIYASDDYDFPNDFIDTLRWARRLLKLDHHRLPDVVAALEIPVSEHHRALSDALTCAEIYERLKKKLVELGVELMFAPSARPPIKRTVDSFGRPVIEIDETIAAKYTPDPESQIYGKTFVFTGALSCFTRDMAHAIVAAMGGTPGKGVTMKTDYLVVGNMDFPRSVTDGRSAKMKKVDHLNEIGAKIKIISENSFLEMIRWEG